MSKVVVIFGAGASYDALDINTNSCNKNLQPPLTKDLFDMRFDYHVNKIIHSQHRIPGIRAHVKGGRSLEEYLASLKIKSESNAIIKVELLEIQLYLRDLLYDISQRFLLSAAAPSNYSTFLKEFHDYGIYPVLVTFNYDLLLDNAFSQIFGTKLHDLEYYTNGQAKLYKLHGSVNWGYLTDRNRSQTSINEEALRLSRLDFGLIKAQSKGVPTIINQDDIFWPALSVPIPSEKGFIVENYGSEIEQHIKNAEKIVIIGWSGSDDYFVNLIRDNVEYAKTTLFVIGGRNVQNVVDKLSDTSSPWLNVILKKTGFSRFFADPETLKAICSSL